MDLMQKLSETKVDTSLFRSTKTMGAAKESKREQMRRALLEEKFGINMEENSKILYEERKIRGPEELELVELPQTVKGITGGAPGKTDEVGESDQVAIKVPETKNIVVGSGLKRPLESDTNGQPIIKKVRKSREVREERLLAMIETMERQRVQEAGNSSMDEDEDEEIDSESSKEDNDSEEEEWGGILDSPIAGGDAVVDTPRAVISGEGDSDDSDDSGGDGEDDEEENELVPRLKRGRSEKANAFKKWALVQRRQVMNGGDPLDTDTSMPSLLALKPGVVHVHVPRKREVDMTPPPELQAPTVERKVCSGQNQKITTKGRCWDTEMYP